MSRVKKKSGWSKEIIRLVSSTNQTGVTAFESREQHVRFIGSSGIPKGYLVAHATSATQRQGASRALIMAHFTGAARLARNMQLETGSSIRTLTVMRDYIFFIAAIGIVAHGLVLYKIDTGLRANELTPVVASRSHQNFW